MSLSGISSVGVRAVSPTVSTEVQPAQHDSRAAAETGAIGGGAAGAYGVQQPDGRSLLKKLAVGGVVGAGLGFAASFLPLNPVTTAIGRFIPGPARLGLAAVGGALGVAAGGISHLLAKRKASLAMEGAAAPAGQAPVRLPGISDATLQAGAKGKEVRTMQIYLQKAGVYDGKVNSTFDKATEQAVRKYEVLKGMVPTGIASPDLRSALKQDVAWMKQHV